MSYIDVRDENGIRIAKFGNMAGMKVIDGMRGRWTTVGKFNKPAFLLNEDMKITLGHDSSEMIVFFYKGTKFILEGE
jgi:hypothetical protein